MILVYTGNGKGKTSACLGQVVRALGHNLRVYFVQFLKKDGEAGEQAALQVMLKRNFLAAGLGFFIKEEDRQQHREAAQKALAWAEHHLKKADVLIMDEALYALGMQLITLEELRNFLVEAAKLPVHVVLSGRGFPDELLPFVDMVSEIKKIKHPWEEGKNAVPGVDY